MAGALVGLLVLAGLGVAASGVLRAPATDEGGIHYSDPSRPQVVRAAAAGVDLPAGAQELVDVPQLRLARRENGTAYLVGPSVIPGVVCMVAVREDAPAGAPAAIGCDRREVAEHKGMFLAGDEAGSVAGAAYIGGEERPATVNGAAAQVRGGVVPFRLSAGGGEVVIDAAGSGARTLTVPGG